MIRLAQDYCGLGDVVKIKRIKSIYINARLFTVTWDNTTVGGCFSYKDNSVSFGTKRADEGRLFESICHELWEVAAIECNTRLDRPDVNDDCIFVYDHRQHHTMTAMFSGWLRQFLEIK